MCMTALKLVGLGRPRRSSAQAAFRRTGTARGHCARDRERSDVAAGGRTTGDLDSHSATEVLEILKRLNEDFHKTIVMVTHDPHAASYAHVTRHLEKGMLLPPG